MDEQLFLIAKQEIQDMVGFCLKKLRFLRKITVSAQVVFANFWLTNWYLGGISLILH